MLTSDPSDCDSVWVSGSLCDQYVLVTSSTGLSGLPKRPKASAPVLPVVLVLPVLLVTVVLVLVSIPFMDSWYDGSTVQLVQYRYSGGTRLPVPVLTQQYSYQLVVSVLGAP